MPTKGSITVPKVPRICDFCGTPFAVYPSALRWGPRLYCSRACDNASRVQPIADRFWSKVAISGPNDCWLWQSHLWGEYGGFYRSKHDHVYAHRMAWELTYGPIPDGLLVLHTCDNPPCVNPQHFFLGTNADNTADMVSKGRAALGERNASARLTADAVGEIRSRYTAGGITQRELAEQFGVTQTVIGDVVRRKSWKHVA